MGVRTWFRKYRADRAEQRAIKLQKKALDSDTTHDYLEALQANNDDKAKEILKQHNVIRHNDSIEPIGAMKADNSTGVLGGVLKQVFDVGNPVPQDGQTESTGDELSPKDAILNMVKKVNPWVWIVTGGIIVFGIIYKVFFSGNNKKRSKF